MDFSKRPGKRIEKIGEIVKEEKPTISIVTPFYNGGKTIVETANGVFSQTYPFFEWIIVDDGSKDKESLQKLDEVAKMDKRVRVFHKKNGGPAIARDFGIDKTGGVRKESYRRYQYPSRRIARDLVLSSCCDPSL